MKQGPKPGPKPPEKIDHHALNRLVRREALAILQKCGAPKSWSEAEAWFLIRILLRPEPIIMTGRVGGGFRYTDDAGAITEQAIRGMWFANLFAEAPKTLIKALPQLDDLIDKRTKARWVAIEALLGDGWHWKNEEPAQTLDRLFATGNNLKQRLGITVSTIKHAKEWIRKHSNGPDYGPPWWAGLEK